MNKAESKFKKMVERYYSLYIYINRKLKDFYNKYGHLFKNGCSKEIKEELQKILDLYKEYCECSRILESLEINLTDNTIISTICYVALKRGNEIKHFGLYYDYPNPTGWYFIESCNLRTKLKSLAEELSLNSANAEDEKLIVDVLEETRDDLFDEPLFQDEKEIKYYIYDTNNEHLIKGNNSVRNVHYGTINSVNTLAKRDLNRLTSPEEEKVYEYILYKLYPLMIRTSDDNIRRVLTNYADGKTKTVRVLLDDKMAHKVDEVMNEYLTQELESGNIYYKNEEGHNVLCVPDDLSYKVIKQIEKNNKRASEEQERRRRRNK